MDLSAHRAEAEARGLDRDDLDADPLAQFATWFEEVTVAGVHQPEAMVVATADAAGRPSARHVLLKGVDTGFVFFTNYASQKGAELAVNANAALCFPWNDVSRQVRVVGPVEQVSAAESDEYFATRPRGSQLGAWASHQSEVIADRSVIDDRLAAATARFEGRDVERPATWGGYRVTPVELEFWQGRPSRLHDRFRYVRDPGDPSGWHVERLSP